MENIEPQIGLNSMPLLRTGLPIIILFSLTTDFGIAEPITQISVKEGVSVASHQATFFAQPSAYRVTLRHQASMATIRT